MNKPIPWSKQGNKARQKTALLRVCASCEWIFRWKDKSIVSMSDCPKCGWASYGARFVYSDKCYKYAKTQEPWIEKKICQYRLKLMEEV